MPSTFVHAMLPSACVASRDLSVAGLSRRQYWGLLLCCAIISNFPDLDVIGVIVMPQYAELIHRELGHNLLALCVWVILGRWMLGAVSPLFGVPRAYLYSTVLVMSHVLLDSGCLHGPGRPAGVPLLWPWSEWELISPVPLFIEYHLNLQHDWFLGHLLASDYWTRAAINEFSVSFVIFIAFVVIDRGGRWLFARFSRTAASQESEPHNQVTIQPQ